MNDADLSGNPFPGLRPFREDEEHLFFGREEQVDAMIDKLAETRLLAVVGTSGSGKSSLVNCGLIPGLRRGQLARAGSAWRVAVMRPGHRPVRALAEALCRRELLGGGQAPVEGYAPADLMEATLGMSNLGLVDAVGQARLEARQNLLLVVDQFEELFRYQALGKPSSQSEPGAAAQTAEQATAFVKLLLEAVQQQALPIWVVLTMRSDFLGECAQFFGLPEVVSRGQYLVPRLTRDERRAAISEPLRLSGTPIDAALLTRLVNDVGDNPDQLSILQHALNRTWVSWLKAGGSGALTLDHYEAAGTMADALDLHAEEALTQLQPGRQRVVAEKLFQAITDRVTDARGTRRPTGFLLLQGIVAASADELEAVIDAFRDPQRCFLMPPAGISLQPDTPIDISHETLMRVWKNLQQWGNAEAQSAQTYRRLSETAELHRNGKKLGLLRQPDLQFYVGWKTREKPNVAWAERYLAGFEDTMAFLQLSERAERRRVWRVRGIAAVVVVLPMLVAGWIFNLYQLADEARRMAVDGQSAAKLAGVQATDAKTLAEGRLRETRAAQHQAETSRGRAEDLLAFLIGEDFLEKLRPVGRIDILDDVQKKVQLYLGQAQGSDGQRPTALHATGLASRNAGDLLLSRGELTQALVQFKESADTFGRLARQAIEGRSHKSFTTGEVEHSGAVADGRLPGTADPTLQAQIEQGRSLFRLGDAQLAQGGTTVALATHRQALNLRQLVVVDGRVGPQARDAAIELSLSHSAVGRVLNDLGRPRDALRELDTSLALLGPLRTDKPTPKLLKALIDAHDNRADAFYWLDDAPGQRRADKEAGGFTDDWRRRYPLSAEARQGEVAVGARRATGMIENGSEQAALDAYQRMEASMEELVNWDASNKLWERDLLAIRILKADVQKNLGYVGLARQKLDQMLPSLQALAATDPSDLSRLRDLGWLNTERGRLATGEKRWADAVRHLAAAERYYGKAAAAAPDNARWHQDWYLSIYRLALAQRDAGHSTEALIQVRKGRNVVAGLIRGAPQMAMLVPYQVRYFYTLELQLLNKPGDAGQADGLVRQMQDLLARALAAARPPGAKLLDAAGQADHLRAERADAAGRAADALLLRLSGLEKQRQASARDPADVQGWDNLADAASALAKQHAKALRWRDAAAAYSDEIGARQQALKLAPQQLRNTASAPSSADQPLAAPDKTPIPDAAGDKSPPLAPSLGSRANRLYLAQINLGDALDNGGEPNEALDAYNTSLASIKHAIALNSSHAIYYSNLRQALLRTAKIRAKLDDSTGALKTYAEAEQPAKWAFERARSPEERARHANSANLLDIEQGDLLVKQQNHSGALAKFAKAGAWIDKAVADAPQASLYQGNLATLRLRMATQQRELGNTKAEETALRDAKDAAELAVRLAAAGETAADQAARQLGRMRAYNDLAAWHARQQDQRATLAARRDAKDAVAQAAALEPGLASHKDALRAAHRAIAEQEIDPGAVETAWRASADAALRAVAQGPSAERSNQAAQSLFHLGDHLETQTAWAPALRAYQQAAQQAQLAANSDSRSAEHWLALSACQRQVGQMLKKLPGRANEAGAVFEAAIAAGGFATERAPRDARNWQALYLARHYLALQLEQDGNPAAALTLLDQALQEAERAIAINRNDLRIEQELDALREAVKRGRP